jgi:hypothetical protein
MTIFFKCDNCKFESDSLGTLKPCKDLQKRIGMPGDKITVPAGDCPDCGAFCFPERRYYHHIFSINFSVISPYLSGLVSPEELMIGFKRRARFLTREYDDRHPDVISEAVSPNGPSSPTNKAEWAKWKKSD